VNSSEDYFKDREFRELLENYEQAVRSGQPIFMDADDLADIADYYQMKGRFDEAKAALNRAEELEPDSVVVLNYKIHNAIDAGDFDKAEEYLSQILDSELPEYIYSRAEIWLAQEEVTKAEEYLRECLNDVPPEEIQDYVLDVVNLYSDYNYDEKALEWMMLAKQDNTDDFKELMGRVLFGMGKYDDSERIFNELIDRNPFEKRYWNALANTQFMKEDYGAAIASSEFAIAIDPNDAEGILSKANGLIQLDNYEEALKYYQHYSEQVPDDEFGFLNQGICFINLGRYEEAATQLIKAKETAPEDSVYLVEIYRELGFAYSELKMPETALYYIDKTEKLECDHVDMLVIKGHIQLANGFLKQAEETFKLAIKNTTCTPRTMLRIIVSYYDNKYFETCYNLFQKLLEFISDDYNEGFSYMALCCYSLKRYDEFLRFLKMACERNPKEAGMVLSHLFPEGMSPDDYYEYMAQIIKTK